MSSNLDLWHKVSEPPSSALKTIGAGRLKGMTDINPQWRLMAITEAFGECGVGWTYDIVEKWTVECHNGELMVFIQVNLYTIKDGIKSLPIPGIGGSKLISKENAGLHNNDEGYKMALTDALSVALKQLGVGSAIYEGRWDGSKYKESSAMPANIEDQINACGTFKEISDLWKKVAIKDRADALREHVNDTLRACVMDTDTIEDLNNCWKDVHYDLREAIKPYFASRKQELLAEGQVDPIA